MENVAAEENFLNGHDDDEKSMLLRARNSKSGSIRDRQADCSGGGNMRCDNGKSRSLVL